MRTALLLAVLAGLLVASSGIPITKGVIPDIEKKLHDTFVEWKEKFNRAYEGTDHLHRFVIWKENLERITVHNAAFKRGEETFHMAVNQFADLTKEEFKKFQGYKPNKLGAPPPPPGPKPGKACGHRNLLPADAVDWREKGGVTNVKDQGQCGSCWSFSTTGAVEGAWFVAGNPLVALSEEELVQCDTSSDEGCNGGLMDNAFEFIMKMGGITSEELYPYVSGNGTTGTCKARLIKTKVAHISDFCDVIPKNETDLELALNQQPVAVAIEADQGAFQFYAGGVIPAKKCGISLDHGVLAVGYGYDDKHKMKYWTVKNSWSASWGEEGYVRIQKNPKGSMHSGCGIAEDASYAVV